jgi:putative phosphoserine phosphatase/1-acylglycerol-3-phosphate O-acyltransferase
MTLHKDVIKNIERSPEGPQIGAFFDFDGTLIAGFSATVFLKEQVRRGDVSPYEFLEMLSAVAQFSLGGMGFSGLMSSAAQFMRGVREQDYIEFGEELFEQQISRKVYPESRALVRAHQARGHTVAIISSATPYQVEPMARDLDVEHVVCSRYEVKDGVFTGGIMRPLCFGPGKVLAAEKLAGEYGIDLSQSFFYTDSDDDIELLERVGKPQPLNPNTKLTEISEREGWPIRRFKSRGQPHVTDILRSVAATISLVPSAIAGVPIWALTGSRREARNFATSLFADVSSALIGLKLVVRGEQNLWSNRPAVFVFNHQSKADVVIMARLLRRDIAGVGKKEIKNMPLIGKTMELAGTVFIDREKSGSAIEAMRPLVEAMRNGGKSVVIAPEGTRTISPKLAPFKKGAFHLAIQAGVPIVPVVIHNAGDVAPKGDFVFRPATVEVDVLPPVDTSQWNAETIDEHVAEVRGMFKQVLGQEEHAEEAVIAASAPRTFEVLPEARDKPSGKVIRKKALRKKPTAKKVALKKVALKKVAPKKVAPKKVAPKKVALKKVAPKKAAPEKAAPKKAAPKKAAPKKAAPRKAAPRKAAPRKAAPRKAAPRKAAPRKAAARKAAPEKAAPRKAAPGKAAPRKVVGKKVAAKKVARKTPVGETEAAVVSPKTEKAAPAVKAAAPLKKGLKKKVRISKPAKKSPPRKKTAARKPPRKKPLKKKTLGKKASSKKTAARTEAGRKAG